MPDCATAADYCNAIIYHTVLCSLCGRAIEGIFLLNRVSIEPRHDVKASTCHLSYT